MRILRVSGQNLASLSDPFEVRLDRGALGRAGLFAITGPTGAGKSTLLDAVCLCLYDRTPRLEDRKRPIQVAATAAGAELALGHNDVRSILRRGASSGWAEVDFRGKDGRVWTARWEARRARLRADGKVQNQELSLRDDQGRLVGGKKTETLQAIQDRVGLDFDQFRRSVLLAQGDFAAFLRADASERASLLEQMTGTAIYSKLSKAAHGRRGELDLRERELRARLAAQGLMDAPARQAAELALAQVSQERTQAAGLAQGAEAAVRWHQQDQALTAALDQARAGLQEAQEAWQGAHARREALARAERAWPLRSLARQVQQTTAQAAQAAAQAVGVEQDRDRAVQQEQDAGSAATLARAVRARAWQGLAAQLLARLEGARSAQQEEQAWLDDHPRHQDLAATGAVETVQRALARHAQARAEDRAAGQRLGALTEQAPALAVAREQADAARREAATRTATCQAALDAARLALGEHDRDGLEQERRALALRQRAGAELLRLAERADTLATARDQARAARDQALRDQEAAQALALDAQAADLALQPRLDEARQAVESARAALDAQGLRATLVPGQPCPVCGGRDHPWADGSPLAALHGQLQARLQELEDQRRAVLASQAEASARARAAGQLAAQQAAQADRAQADLHALAAPWAEQIEAAAAALEGPAQATDAVQAWRATLEQAQALLDQRQEQATRAARALEEARSALLVQQQQDAQVERAAAAAATKVVVAEQEAQAARARQDRALQDLAQALSELSALLDPLLPELPALAGWPDRLDAPDPLLQTCRDAAQEQHRRARRREQAREAAARIEREHAAAVPAAAQALAATTDPDLARAPTPAPPPGLDAPATTEWWRRLAEGADRDSQQAQAALEQAGKLREQAALQAQAAAARALALDQQARDLSAQHQQGATALGLDARALDGLLALPDAWLDQERAAMLSLEQAPAQARVLLAERQANWEALQATRPSLDAAQASQELERARQALSSADEAWGRARAVLQADDDAHARAAELRDQLDAHQALAQPWLQLASCIGSPEGDRFKRFAQSLTLELLLEQSNQHLRALNPRYSLARVIHTDLDLLVIDHDLGDQERAVQSLSGGESFLASLALALGLSSLSSRDVRVESLFIDEGFGTLDVEALDVATDAIESLQKGGRMVGVISHVPTLNERLRAQVLVKRDAQGSRVEVVR